MHKSKLEVRSLKTWLPCPRQRRRKTGNTVRNDTNFLLKEFSSSQIFAKSSNFELSLLRGAPSLYCNGEEVGDVGAV